jgi:hypothetical protein
MIDGLKLAKWFLSKPLLIRTKEPPRSSACLYTLGTPFSGVILRE